MNGNLASALLAALAATTLSLQAAEPPDPVPLRIISINDFHGHLEAGNNSLTLADPTGAPGATMRVPSGGAAALAGMVKRLRAGSPYSIMIGAGDLVGAAPLVSALFRHESAVDVLNDMGLDVSSLGNHEFDAGTEELKRLIKGGCARTAPDSVVTSCPTGKYSGARFTYLGVNVRDARGRPIVAPYVVKHFAGIPVAIIGGVTRSTPQLVSPSGIVGLKFLEEAEAVNRAADELRAKGIRSMVAVFHEGLELGTAARRGDWNDESCPMAHGPLVGIAQRLAPEIRVVVSGHTHQGYRCLVGGRVLVQGTAFGRGVSVVDVELDRSTRAMLPPVRSYNLAVVNEHTEAAVREKLAAAAPAPFGAVLREARPDPKIAGKVAAYAALVKPKAERPVAKIGGPFVASRSARTDTSMGRLIADAQLAASRSEGSVLALMNPGGIRASIDCGSPPCPVTFGQVFTVQPFGNSLVVMNLTGAQLKAALEQQQRSGDPYFLQPSEGFTFAWDEAAPRGDRVRDMRLNGAPIDPARTYRVTVNSFLAEGGDGFTVFTQGTDKKGGGQDIDVLMAWLAAEQRSPNPTPRITRRQELHP